MDTANFRVFLSVLTNKMSTRGILSCESRSGSSFVSVRKKAFFPVCHVICEMDLALSKITTKTTMELQLTKACSAVLQCRLNWTFDPNGTPISFFFFSFDDSDRTQTTRSVISVESTQLQRVNTKITSKSGLHTAWQVGVTFWGWGAGPVHDDYNSVTQTSCSTFSRAAKNKLSSFSFFFSVVGEKQIILPWPCKAKVITNIIAVVCSFTLN